MGSAQLRGGIPYVERVTTGTSSATMVNFPFNTNWVRLRNAGAAGETVKVYFTQADADADANYVLLPIAAAATPNGEWEGPLDLQALWLKSSSGTPTVEVVATQKRG